MRKTYVIVIIAIVLAVAALAVIVPIIEKGMASQSQTDNTDDMEPGTYIKATSYDGKAVSIPSVTYFLSDDKEYYELVDMTKSSSGSLRVKTPNNADMGLRVVVNFQDSGSWMFINTIDLTMKRQLGFITLVENGVSLTGTTVIWLDQDGGTYQTGLLNEEGKNTASKPTGWTNYKKWGCGNNISTNYTLSTSDVYNGFVILVKDGCNFEGYNVVKVLKNSTVGVNSNRPLGYVVPDMDGDYYKKWRVWYSNNIITGYTVDNSDAVDKSGNPVTMSIYNSVGVTGVAGNPSEYLRVSTGYYDYSIDVKYKSKIKIDPTEFHGDNMVSNVVFLLGSTDPVKDPLEGVTIEFYPNHDSLPAISGVVYTESRIDVKQLSHGGSMGLGTGYGSWKYWDGTVLSSDNLDSSKAFSGKRFVAVVNNSFVPANYTIVKINEDGTGTVVTGKSTSDVIRLNGNWYPWGITTGGSVGVNYHPNADHAISGLIVLVNEHYDMSKINDTDGNDGKYVVIEMEASGKYGTSFPEVTQTGYNVSGWYTQAEGGDLITSDDIVDITIKKLYAHWTPNTTTVTLDKQDQPIPNKDTVTWTYDQLVSGYSVSEPSRTGYTFGGYYTGMGGEGTQVYGSSGQWVATNGGIVSDGKMVYNADGFHKTITLYAKWTEVISLDVNGGSGSNGSLTVTYNSRSFDEITEVPTKTGHTFTGYATASSAGKMLINASNLSSFINNDVEGYLIDGKWTRDETDVGATSIYAQWSVNKYKILWMQLDDTSEIKLGESEVNFNVVPVYQGTPTMLPTEHDVYTFVGWTADKTKVIITSGDPDYAPDALPSVTGNATYYAVFKKTGVATFDLNGGTVASTPSGWTLSNNVYTKDFDYGTAKATIISDFGDYSREGYTKGTEVVSADTMGTSGMTISASWT